MSIVLVDAVGQVNISPERLMQVASFFNIRDPKEVHVIQAPQKWMFVYNRPPSPAQPRVGGWFSYALFTCAALDKNVAYFSKRFMDNEIMLLVCDIAGTKLDFSKCVEFEQAFFASTLLPAEVSELVGLAASRQFACGPQVFVDGVDGMPHPASPYGTLSICPAKFPDPIPAQYLPQLRFELDRQREYFEDRMAAMEVRHQKEMAAMEARHQQTIIEQMTAIEVRWQRFVSEKLATLEQTYEEVKAQHRQTVSHFQEQVAIRENQLQQHEKQLQQYTSLVSSLLSSASSSSSST